MPVLLIVLALLALIGGVIVASVVQGGADTGTALRLLPAVPAVVHAALPPSTAPTDLVPTPTPDAGLPTPALTTPSPTGWSIVPMPNTGGRTLP